MATAYSQGSADSGKSGKSSKPPQPAELAGEFYRELFDLSSEALLVLGLSASGAVDRIIAVNDAACAAIGLAREQLLAASADDFQLTTRHEDERSVHDARSNARLTIMLGDARSSPGAMDVAVRNASIEGRECLVVGLAGESGEAGEAGESDDARREASDALRKSEYSLSFAQRLASIGSLEWDLVSNVGTWSDEFYRILGMEPGEVEPGLGAYLHFVHKDDRAFVLDGITAMHEAGEGRRVDVRIVAKDGTEKLVESTSDLIKDDSGRVIRQFSSIQDVTAIRSLQHRVRVSEDLMLRAQELAHLGTWIAEIPGGKAVWSDELHRICGVEIGQWDGSVETFLRDFSHPDDVEATAAAWYKMRDTHEAQEVEHRIIRPSGEIRWLLTRGEAVFDEAGKPTHVLGAAWDITDLREGEEARRHSEERLELAATGSSDGLWDWPDLREDYYWVSPRFEELLGYATGELSTSLGAGAELVHPEDMDRVVHGFEAHLESDVPYDVEVRMRTVDGGYRWFRQRGRIYRSPDGTPHRMAGSLLDIDERKRADEQLVAYQEQLRALAEAVSKAAEGERRRIGTELHDGAIQSLGYMRVKLAEFRAGLYGSERDHELLAEIFQLADDTIRETRALLQELSPPVLYELGFAPAVEWLAERAEDLYGYACRVDCLGVDIALTRDTEVVLFQAVRELLTNAGRHSSAKNVSVVALSRNDEFVVQISDDGIGFTPEQESAVPRNTGGFGLFNLRERLRVLDGRLEIESQVGQGAKVGLRVPLNETTLDHSRGA